MQATETVMRMVQSQPGGVPAMAARLGVAASSLGKQLMAHDGHKLGLETAHQIACLTGSLELAKVFAEPLGMVVLNEEVAAVGAVALNAPLHLTGELTVTAAELVKVVLHAMEDGRISVNELKAIKDGTFALNKQTRDMEASVTQLHKSTQRS